MMAQAMFIYYGLMPLLGINSTITQAAILSYLLIQVPIWQRLYEAVSFLLTRDRLKEQNPLV